jgi:hypothetical protein
MLHLERILSFSIYQRPAVYVAFMYQTHL